MVNSISAGSVSLSGVDSVSKYQKKGLDNQSIFKGMLIYCHDS